MCFLCIQKHVKTYNNFLTVVRQTNFGQIVNHINPNNFLPSTGIQKVVVDHFTITAQLRRYRPWGGGQVSIPSKRYKICTIRHRTYTDGFRITDYGKLRHPVHQHHRKLFIPQTSIDTLPCIPIRNIRNGSGRGHEELTRGFQYIRAENSVHFDHARTI